MGISYIAYYDLQELRGLNPGDIFIHSMTDIRIVHGQSFQESMPTKFARIVEGDVSDLHKIADRVQLEGAKMMRMSRPPPIRVDGLNQWVSLVATFT